jgi:hypothetical protein
MERSEEKMKIMYVCSKNITDDVIEEMMEMNDASKIDSDIIGDVAEVLICSIAMLFTYVSIVNDKEALAEDIKVKILENMIKLNR